MNVVDAGREETPAGEATRGRWEAARLMFGGGHRVVWATRHARSRPAVPMVCRCQEVVFPRCVCFQGGSSRSGDHGNLNHAGRQEGAASVGERRKLASKTAEFHTAPNPLSSSCDSQEYASDSSCKRLEQSSLPFLCSHGTYPAWMPSVNSVIKTSPVYARWNSRVEANQMTFLVLVLSELIHGPASVLCNLEVHSGPWTIRWTA
jgi:hypothetical protein